MLGICILFIDREILDSKYILLNKLGWGHFSTVWLAFNIHDKKLYALKILRSHKKYINSGFDEEELCKTIADNYNNPLWNKSVKLYLKSPSGIKKEENNSTVPKTNYWFFHHSIHGKHFVMTFEVLASNLLALVRKYDYRGIPIPIKKKAK